MNEAQTIKAQVQPITECKNLINGEAFGSDSVLPVYNPATGEQIAALHEADAQVVDRAVSAAQKSFQSGVWRDLTVEERQSVLRKIAQLVDEHAETLAGLECLNTGIPYAHLLAGQIRRVALNFRFFADYIGQSEGDLYTQNPDYLTYVRRDSVGVCALVGPWNAPLALTTMKLAAALAFGNSCVVKASEQTPMTLLALMPLLQQAGVPDGVVNVVNGSGVVTGAALSAHAGIARISFTGGTQTGKQIMTLAAQNLTPVTMELGGKSANIVFASADLEKAVDGALLGIFSNNGQQCLAGSRIFLESGIAGDFIDTLITRTQNIRVGDPFDPETEIGALGSMTHMEKVLSYVGIGQKEGGNLLTGGEMIEELAPGAFMQPTLMHVEDNAMRVCQEEIFGPFGVIQTFDSANQAWALANDTSFGLVSYVWSENLSTIMDAQKRLESGLLWVNTPMVRELRAPFGGVKDSGIGRESGKACEQFYTEEKTVTLPVQSQLLTKLGNPDARGS